MMNQQGTIITFYSYKGGTGRSMSLANVACLLSRKFEKSSKRILMADFDLEAPGLHNFFSRHSEKISEERKGIIDYFCSLQTIFKKNKRLYKKSIQEGWTVFEKKMPLDDYIVRDVLPNLDIMKAGKFDAGYSERVTSFDWYDFYNQFGEAIRIFGELLASRYEYVLIDSRTGLTDISGICTMLLPEKLVGVFTPNRQSIDGLLKLIRQAVEYRRASNDFRPLAIFPLPSRVERDMEKLRQEWRNDYQNKFEKLFQELYQTKECDLSEYFDEVMLPHIKDYAYGEEIAVLVEERSDSSSMSRAYQKFYGHLIELDFAWQETELYKDRIKVFISYASEDYAIAKKLYDDLNREGISPWLDREDLLPGQNWRTTIPNIIRDSSYFFLIISKNSVSKRGYIQKEQKIALELLDEFPPDKIFIIPARVDNTEPIDERLKNLQWAELSDYEKGLRQILISIGHQSALHNSEIYKDLPNRVFISYASEDYSIAKRIYDDLNHEGIDPWLDREDLRLGQDWRQTIPNIIRKSSYFLLIISKNSVSKKGFIQKEQKIALELLDEFPSEGIFIIPARLDNTEPSDEKLKNLHWADLSDYKNGLRQILKVFQLK
ncbi:MAG: TIR domain-containing protein [Desulfococcaceae bacterium]